MRPLLYVKHSEPTGLARHELAVACLTMAKERAVCDGGISGARHEDKVVGEEAM